MPSIITVIQGQGGWVKLNYSYYFGCLIFSSLLVLLLNHFIFQRFFVKESVLGLLLAVGNNIFSLYIHDKSLNGTSSPHSFNHFLQYYLKWNGVRFLGLCILFFLILMSKLFSPLSLVLSFFVFYFFLLIFYNVLYVHGFYKKNLI